MADEDTIEALLDAAQDVVDTIRDAMDSSPPGVAARMESGEWDGSFDVDAEKLFALRKALRQWSPPLSRLQRSCLLEVWTRGSSRRVDGGYSLRTYEALVRKGLMESVDDVFVVTPEGARRAKVCR